MTQREINTKFKKIQLTVVFLAVLDYIQFIYPVDLSILLYLADLITLMYILYTFAKAKRKKNYIRRNREVLIMMSVLALSLLVNMHRSDIYSIIRLAEVFAYITGGMWYSGEEDMEAIKKYIRKLLLVLLVCASVMIWISAVECLIGMVMPGVIGAETAEKWTKGIMRLQFGGIFNNGNRLGLCALITMMLSFYFVKGQKSFILYINIMLSVIFLAFSGARGVLVGIIFAIAYVVFNIKDRRVKYALLGVIAVLIMFIALFTSLKMWMYAQKSYHLNVLLDKITGNRYTIWCEVLKMFGEYPWFGVGLNNISSTALENPEVYQLIVTRHYLSAHNSVLNILAFSGIVGAVGFIPITRVYFWSFRKLPVALSALVISLLVSDLFDMNVLFVSEIGSAIVPMLLGAAYQELKNNEHPVYFFSNVMSEELFAQTYKKKDRPGQQSQKFNRLIAQGFEKNGIRVVCYTAVLASRSIVDYTVEKFKNSGFYRYSLSINIPGIKNLYHFLSAFFRVLTVEEGYCLVDPLSIDQSLGALFAGKIRRMPVAGVITDLPEHFAGEGFYAKLSYFAFKLCDGYVFLTKQMDELLNPKHKPWILMEGLCDIDAAREVVTERDNALIFAGEIDEQNGVITLIDAFNEWNCDKYELYYYGSGEAMELLKEKSKDNPHVHIMGVVLNKDLIPVMNRATLLLNPRPVNQEFTKYSFPSKLIEYCSTGTYTATSRLVCIPDDYWLAMGDLGDGSSVDILKFFRKFETMTDAELNELGSKQRKYVLETRNNKKQAGNIYGLMKEIYE